MAESDFEVMLHHLLEVALREQRHDLVPEAAISHRHPGQVDVALDGDREADHEHDGDGVHEFPAALKKSNNCVPEIHRRSPAQTSLRKLNDICLKSCDLALTPEAAGARRRRRIRLQGAVVPVLAPEHVTIHRL